MIAAVGISQTDYLGHVAYYHLQHSPPVTNINNNMAFSR